MIVKCEAKAWSAGSGARLLCFLKCLSRYARILCLPACLLDRLLENGINDTCQFLYSVFPMRTLDVDIFSVLSDCLIALREVE